MQPSFAFEALKYVEGPAYTKHRDDWLAHTPDVATLLRSYEREGDWHTRVTARILLAWLEHRPECEKAVAAVDHAERDAALPSHGHPELDA